MKKTRKRRGKDVDGCSADWILRKEAGSVGMFPF